MKRGLLVFLAICAFAIAMVPKDRRPVITEEPMEIPKGNKEVCELNTPCAWSVYKHDKTIEFNLTNTYCSCGIGTLCVQDEDVKTSNTFVYRCREPAHDEKTADD